MVPKSARCTCMTAGADVTDLKMQQSLYSRCEVVCMCMVCLTMTCLGLRQQNICFHGLRQVSHQPFLLLCFILG